jgi:hypothetical protein
VCTCSGHVPELLQHRRRQAFGPARRRPGRWRSPRTRSPACGTLRRHRLLTRVRSIVSQMVRQHSSSCEKQDNLAVGTVINESPRQPTSFATWQLTDAPINGSARGTLTLNSTLGSACIKLAGSTIHEATQLSTKQALHNTTQHYTSPRIVPASIVPLVAGM